MPATEKLPGLHLVEYTKHRDIECARREAEAKSEPHVGTNYEYAQHMQYASALMTFAGKRAYVRDALDEHGVHTQGTYLVREVSPSQDPHKGLFLLTLSRGGDGEEVFTASVFVGTCIMYYK